MGTTPIYGFPYPDPSDLVANYPALGEQLAEDVEDELVLKAPLAAPDFTGTVEVRTGGNALGEGGEIQFGIATLPSSLGMSQIKGYNENAATGEVQGGVSLFTRPVGAPPQALVERMRIDNAGIITGTGSLGPGIAYTPVISGTGWAIGDGTIVGQVQTVGKMVDFLVNITFGTTSTFGTGTNFINVSLPRTLVTNFNRPDLPFVAGATDASTGSIYLLNAFIASTTTVLLTSNFTPVQGVNNIHPFTWDNLDRISIYGRYEMV